MMALGRISEEKAKDYPKSIPLKIIAKDLGNCAYSKTLTATNTDTANDVILMALQQLGINVRYDFLKKMYIMLSFLEGL
ncbi:UNVERIFIED_CONTAM: Rho GTPase-activating protein 20 [Gekko kuhli]